jgi:leucine-rich PPR motif-containing protein
MESAAGILGVMQQAGLEPSADTYTTLLCGYAKKGDIDAITETLEQCDAKDIQLLDRDYMDIIYSLAINNHLEHVDTVSTFLIIYTLNTHDFRNVTEVS